MGISRQGPPSEERIQEEIKVWEELGVNMTEEQILLEDQIDFYDRMVTTAQCLLVVPVYSLLVYGVQKPAYKFIFPTLVWIPVNFSISMISMAASLYLMGIDHTVVIVALLVASGIAAILDLLIWLCVYSHWQLVKVQVGAPQKLPM